MGKRRGVRASQLALGPTLLATVLATLLWTPNNATASPQEVLGFGYRSQAMGRTGAAVGRGVDTVYANPAMLSREHRSGLELGLLGASFDLYAEGGTWPAGAPLPAYPSLRANTIGGILPLPFGGVLKDRVTIGVGFVTPFDVIVRGRILYPEKPQFLLADRVQSVAVQAGIGLDLGYGIRIGGGFAALAALTGSVTVGTDASGRIGTLVDDTLVASFAPILGAGYDIDDNWRLGATFRGELVGRFNVVIRANDLGGLAIPPLNISGIAQYDPWQLELEGAYVDGPWQLALGITYKHWAAYPGPVEATVRCEDSPEPEEGCSAPQPPDAGYSSVAAPHVGVEHTLPLSHDVNLALRAGYAFEPSGAPEQSSRRNSFDNHRSAMSLGYGVLIEGDLAVRFDGFAQLQLLHGRSHLKEPVAPGVAAIPIDTGGSIVAGGTSVQVMF